MKNKALAALEPFIGRWDYTMYNCWFLESLSTEVRGSTSIEWLHDAFMVVQTTGADKSPEGVWVVGYSDPQEKYYMMYHDERGVARMFNATFDGKRLVFLREDKDFYQRITIEITEDGLHSIAEASDDKGKTWCIDLEMKHVRK